MALWMHAPAPLPRIVFPAFSSLTNRNNYTEHKHYSSFSLTRLHKASSPVLIPAVKASQNALKMMRTISEKDDNEIQAKLTRVQNECKKLKGILGDIILVLMTTNPLFQCLFEILDSKSRFLRWSSIGASYGAFVVLKEFGKVLYKSQPLWGLIIVGYLIYKANMCNIALYRKGHNPVWFGVPLAVLPLGKVAADFALLLDSSNVAPFSVIVVFFEFMASMIMLDLLPDNSSFDQKATSADETLISVPRRRRRRRKTKTIRCCICSKRLFLNKGL